MILGHCKHVKLWQLFGWSRLRAIPVILLIGAIRPTFGHGARACRWRTSWNRRWKYQWMARWWKRIIRPCRLHTTSGSLRRELETKWLTGLRTCEWWPHFKTLLFKWWDWLSRPRQDLTLLLVVWVTRGHGIDRFVLHSYVKILSWLSWVPCSLNTLNIVELLKLPPTTFSSMWRVPILGGLICNKTGSENIEQLNKPTVQRCKFVIKKLISSSSLHLRWDSIVLSNWLGAGNGFAVVFALGRHGRWSNCSDFGSATRIKNTTRVKLCNHWAYSSMNAWSIEHVWYFACNRSGTYSCRPQNKMHWLVKQIQ